jgi:hypothetical protein
VTRPHTASPPTVPVASPMQPHTIPSARDLSPQAFSSTDQWLCRQHNCRLSCSPWVLGGVDALVRPAAHAVRHAHAAQAHARDEVGVLRSQTYRRSGRSIKSAACLSAPGTCVLRPAALTGCALHAWVPPDATRGRFAKRKVVELLISPPDTRLRPSMHCGPARPCSLPPNHPTTSAQPPPNRLTSPPLSTLSTCGIMCAPATSRRWLPAEPPAPPTRPPSSPPSTPCTPELGAELEGGAMTAAATSPGPRAALPTTCAGAGGQ